jgi:methanogenic corrinoid protein MtbC1
MGEASMNMESHTGMLAKIAEAVVQFDEEHVEGLCADALEAGIEANEAILTGLAKGMQRVGELYDSQEYGIPEVLLCADTLNIGMDYLKPHVPAETERMGSRVVIGTVEGDIHSIGKNIVKLMLEVGGFSVVDLGEDVAARGFLEQCREEGSEIVALSTMMTTTLKSMKNTIEHVRENFPDMIFLAGGASVTEETAKRFGALGYAENATEAVKVARELVT